MHLNAIGPGANTAGTSSTKRQTLKLLAGGVLAAPGLLASCGRPSPPAVTVALTGIQPLWIPPLYSGTEQADVTTYALALSASEVPFHAGAKTATYGYNGHAFWGPTLLLKKGTKARMQVTNALTEDTTTHWHGMLVPGPVDGGPHQVVAKGSTWLTEVFTVKNRAATYWYHPHMHQMTQKQMTLGAGGFIIVQDEAEAALDVPRTYGVDDIPLMLTSRRFITLNGRPNQFLYTETAYGDYLLANGVVNAEVALPKQVVRLRILNAEIERNYNLGFDDGRSFYVIGNDGGLLETPVAVTRLLMSPGERYEVLLDLRGDAVGRTLALKSYNGADAGLQFGYAGLEGAQGGEFGSLLNDKTFQVLQIRVIRATANAVTTVPTTLVPSTFPSAAQVSQSRTLAITAQGPGEPFTFNEVGFNMGRINQTVALGATEAWTVHGGNIFGHSFHIHGVQCKLVARNGERTAVKAYESGWKDTFLVPLRESVTFVAKFDEAANADFPYMYHCHMVNHEDLGLMGQFVVL